MQDPVIIKMASDIADTAASYRALKEAQDKEFQRIKEIQTQGFEQLQESHDKEFKEIKETVLKNHDRISKLESFKMRIVYTAGGISAGVGILLPKVSSWIMTHILNS